MKLLKILSIMLLAAIWTILFAYVLLHGSSDILSRGPSSGETHQGYYAACYA